MKQFIVIFVAAATTLSAAVVFTAEAPGVQQTTVAGTETVTFDSLAVGALGAYTSPIGNYSSGAEIVAPNSFGGASQTRYIAVGAQSGTLSYTLTFGGDQTFFGLYWSAMDAGNKLQFYQGSTLVATFTPASFAGLSSAYDGNPNNGQDSSEKFAYLDFTSNGSSTDFDKIVFSNLNSSSGFESDNHSILAPSQATPEPSSGVLLVAGLGAVLVGLRRRTGGRS